ncbi:hypothetical protein GCM10027614_83120 [Micromonospora vulcania]
MEKLRNVYKHFEELAIPIIMSAGMGFSVIFISLANGFNTICLVIYLGVLVLLAARI